MVVVEVVEADRVEVLALRFEQQLGALQQHLLLRLEPLGEGHLLLALAEGLGQHVVAGRGEEVVLDRVLRRPRAVEAERAARVALGLVELLLAEQRLRAARHRFEPLVGGELVVREQLVGDRHHLRPKRSSCTSTSASWKLASLRSSEFG